MHLSPLRSFVGEGEDPKAETGLWKNTDAARLASLRRNLDFPACLRSAARLRSRNHLHFVHRAGVG
jgi:hypothetical protein